MTPPPNPLPIAIIGGGISGLALAIGLHARHIPFHIYESATSFAEIGAGVAFGPNALRAMHLIDPRMRTAYEGIATRNGFASKKGTWFDFVVGMDCGLGRAGEGIVEVRDKEGVGGSNAHRAAFLAVLVDLMPKGRVSFGKRVVGVVEEEGTEVGVKLVFEDGGEARARAVVACDGVKSRMRKLVLGEDDEAVYPRFTGKYAYRSLLSMEKAIPLLGEEAARNSRMWLGLHGHVVTYPIDKGACMNAVAFHTKDDGRWDDERWVLPVEREAMERDFGDWGTQVKGILSLMEKPDMWAFFEHPPARRYNKGRICLMGDAAHASTPYQGAGAGMALEDAYVMAALLGAMREDGGDVGRVFEAFDVERVFEAFDAVRRPRTQKMVRTSRECGMVLDCEGVGVGEDREKMRGNLEGRYAWVWERVLEDDAEEGVRMMGLGKEGDGDGEVAGDGGELSARL